MALKGLKCHPFLEHGSIMRIHGGKMRTSHRGRLLPSAKPEWEYKENSMGDIDIWYTWVDQ